LAICLSWTGKYIKFTHILHLSGINALKGVLIITVLPYVVLEDKALLASISCAGVTKPYNFMDAAIVFPLVLDMSSRVMNINELSKNIGVVSHGR
jgi:hypothetical protein